MKLVCGLALMAVASIAAAGQSNITFVVNGSFSGNGTGSVTDSKGGRSVKVGAVIDASANGNSIVVDQNEVWSGNMQVWVYWKPSHPLETPPSSVVVRVTSNISADANATRDNNISRNAVFAYADNPLAMATTQGTPAQRHAHYPKTGGTKTSSTKLSGTFTQLASGIWAAHVTVGGFSATAQTGNDLNGGTSHIHADANASATITASVSGWTFGTGTAALTK